MGRRTIFAKYGITLWHCGTLVTMYWWFIWYISCRDISTAIYGQVHIYFFLIPFMKIMFIRVLAHTLSLLLRIDKKMLQKKMKVTQCQYASNNYVRNYQPVAKASIFVIMNSQLVFLSYQPKKYEYLRSCCRT